MSTSFRGSAPLHHTLLSNTMMTGVSLQTLHPTRFDRGTVLAQTPYPGIEHDSTTVLELEALLAPLGADMLVLGIKDRVYVPPYPDITQPLSTEESENLRLAPKITSDDRHIQWQAWSAEEIMRRHRVIGPLWSLVTCKISGKLAQKRIIWTSGFRLGKLNGGEATEVGRPVVPGLLSETRNVFIKTYDDHILQADEVKIEGGEITGFSHAAERAHMMELSTYHGRPPGDFAVFRDMLR